MTDFNNSFDMNGWGIFDWDRFPGMIGSLILNLIQWLCLFVYFLESIFWALVRGIKVGENRGKPIYKNLLDAILFDGDKIFDFKNNVIGSLMILFIIIGLVLIVLMSVIAIFKSHLSTKEEDKNPKNVVLGGIKAVILMVLFPVIIYCVLKVTNSLVDAVCIYNKFDTDVKTSLANKIFFMFANSGGQTAMWYDANGKPLFSFMLGETWLTSQGDAETTIWQILNSSSSGNFIGYDTANIGNYDYLFAILVLIVLMIGLFKAIMLLGKRIFDVIVLYVIAPFPIACVPNDDGKRFEIWKDTIISKILASFGIAVAFAIYLVVITELGELFASISPKFKTLTLTVDDNGTFNTGSILTIVYVLILVSGGLAIPAMYTMLATLVSQNAGQLAQSDLQNANADMAFMQRGAHAIGAGALFAADKTGVLGLAKNVLMGKANPQNGQSNVSNALASASSSLGGSSGGGLGLPSNGSRGKLSAVGQVTGLNQGLAGVGKKVLKGGLTVGALGLTGMGLAPALAIAGGIGMAQSGGFLGAKTAFNKIKDKKMTAQQQQKENQIAEKVNEALQNYGDKKKLGLINKDIQKLGGNPVDSAFVLNKLQQDKDEKKASAIAKDLHVDIPHPEVKTKETPKSADDKSLDGFKIPTKK